MRMTDFINNFELNKTHRDSFFKKASENDIEKASKGEGSRGGKVIGHTKSGKPIYEHRPYEHHSKEELHKLADKKAGRDRMNAINELSLRYEQSSGKKASTLALDRKEPFITKEKGAQPSYKHISDMSKDEMHTQAEKMGIKGHKDMSEKELQKKLVEANVDKELEKVKEKKEEENLSEDDKYARELSDRDLSERYDFFHRKHKELGSKMPSGQFGKMRAVEKEWSRRNSLKKSIDDNSLQKAYDTLGLK